MSDAKNTPTSRDAEALLAQLDANADRSWAALVTRLRTQLDRDTAEGTWSDYCATGRVLRSNAPALARFMFAGWVGFAHVAIAIGSFAGIVSINPTGFWTSIAAIVAPTTAIAALQGVYHYSTTKHVMDISPFSGLYGAFEQARYELTLAIGSDTTGSAAAALASVKDIADGFEELLIDYGIARDSYRRTCASSLIRGEYLAAVIDRRDNARNDILDILAEVTAAARVVFSARTDLLEATRPAQLTDTPATNDVATVDSARTTTAQDKLTAARDQLAAQAKATLSH